MTTKPRSKSTKKALRQPPKPRAPRIVIAVTEDDITKAEQNSSSHCMIADALKRLRPDVKHVSVDLQTIRFSDPAKRRRFTYFTPRVAQLALLDFDQGVHTQPIMFSISGGQSTPSSMGRKQPSEPKTLRRTGGGAAGGVTVSGGHTPPVAVLSNNGRVGNRRSFGMRAAGTVTAEERRELNDFIAKQAAT